MMTFEQLRALPIQQARHELEASGARAARRAAISLSYQPISAMYQEALRRHRPSAYMEGAACAACDDVWPCRPVSKVMIED